MEHLAEEIKNEFSEYTWMTSEKSEKLFYYASMVHESNKNFNLTGHRTLISVVNDLVINTLKPLRLLNVPRGTSFIDIGTGSGVPGIVISIVFDHMNGCLIDSNSKKIDFINKLKMDLGLDSMSAISARAEEYVKENKNSFDFCFTRAFGPFFYSAEFGFPALKRGGYLYIYSNLAEENLSQELKLHFKELGGEFCRQNVYSDLGISGGILCRKADECPERFPRRFAIVKRDAARIQEQVL